MRKSHAKRLDNVLKLIDRLALRLKTDRSEAGQKTLETLVPALEAIIENAMNDYRKCKQIQPFRP